MVRGLDTFRSFFAEFPGAFVIIGGAAVQMVMQEAGLESRATNDIDVVLCVEAQDHRFGRAIWDFIESGGYKTRERSDGGKQLFRFLNPKSDEFPKVVEFFSRSVEGIEQPSGAVFTPIPFPDEIASLSAILLDAAYYSFLRQNTDMINGLPVLSALGLVCFKVKAWMDMTERREKGYHTNSRDIDKHRKDVLRLTQLLPLESHSSLPEAIARDVEFFLIAMEEELTEQQLDGLDIKAASALTFCNDVRRRLGLITH